MAEFFSAITNRQSASMHPPTHENLTLRQGQVLVGKVTQLFPDNIATVQIGQHTVTAKLEIPLNVGDTYLFEVDHIAEMPQLKVLTNQMKQISLDEQVALLLKELNLSLTKQNQQLVQEVLAKELPVKLADLQQALNILQENNGEHARTVLLEMLEQQLPITSVTFSAYHALLTDSFQGQLEQLYQSLSQNTTLTNQEQQLLDFLTAILQKPMTNEASIRQEVTNWLTHHPQLLDDLGQITELERVDRSTDQNQSPQLTEPLNRKEVKELVKLLFQKQLAIEPEQIHQLGKALELASSSRPEIANQGRELLHALLSNGTVKQQLLAESPTNVQLAIEQFVHQPSEAHFNEIANPLRQLVNLQLNRDQQSSLYHQLNQSGMENFEWPVKDQFLIQVKDFLLNSGLDYEYQLAQDKTMASDKPTPLKQLLLQVLSNSVSQKSEVEAVLHTLTGQQLTMINDDGRFMYISAAIPGLIGTKKEVEFEFYSRKNEHGRIDPNYCRIAFYLDLAQLGTTVIDMNIQNRIIQLTVYNDTKDITNELLYHKAQLKESLSALNYSLSSVHYKPLPERVEHINSTHKPSEQKKGYQSWDVRI